MANARVLIATISPVDGGVPQMVRFCAALLRKNGFEPVLGHYQPYSVSPELSVPSFKLLTKKPGSLQSVALEGYESHALGAWLPELEFTHYQATDAWRRLMDSCDYHVSASGNCLAALPYVQTRRSFLAWVAAGLVEDRKDRVRKFPLSRRILDRVLNAPVLKHLEKKILKSGAILALSEHTSQVITEIAVNPDIRGMLPVPVDHQFFVPDSGARVAGRVGFSGRLDDPRKNINLLLEAVAANTSAGVKTEAVLMGGKPGPALLEKIDQLGIEKQVCFPGFLSRTELRDLLQTLDVFVLPSFQEGLCISALEAMACGVPVVSTRCGGPEEFVKENETGYLVGFDPHEMANAMNSMMNNAPLRTELATNARRLVIERYGAEHCESIFWNAFSNMTSLNITNPSRQMV